SKFRSRSPLPSAAGRGVAAHRPDPPPRKQSSAGIRHGLPVPPRRRTLRPPARLQDPREAARVPRPRTRARRADRQPARTARRGQRGTIDQPAGPEGAEPRTSQPAQDTAATAPSHPQQQEMRLAVVHGHPVLQIPQDLYIPPDALEVILEAFEGPLDLLLYLIRRQNLDILDIPVAEITRQYVD